MVNTTNTLVPSTLARYVLENGAGQARGFTYRIDLRLLGTFLPGREGRP